MKVFSLDSLSVENSLSLVVSSHKAPYIAGLTIRQASKSLDRILGNLNGDLEVKYSGLSVGQMDKHPGEVGVHGSNGRLYEITVQKDPRSNNVLSRVSSLRDGLKEPISRGESFVVQDSSYEDDDPRRVLVHLHCSIRHDAQRYFFDYALGTANLDPIPWQLLKGAEGIFTLAAPFFQKASVYRARVSNLREDE